MSIGMSEVMLKRGRMFQPGVHGACEGKHGKGSGCQSARDTLVKTDDDGELDQGGQTSAQRVITHFLVQFHLLLGQLFLIALVLFLHILELFGVVKLLHFLAGLDLFHHEGVSCQADQDGEQDDRDAEVAHQTIDGQQNVGHRLYYY